MKLQAAALSDPAPIRERMGDAGSRVGYGKAQFAVLFGDRFVRAMAA
jgi:hypothetical protein